jgi:thiosulfate dehydrogenase [quinone] large subunit
VSTPAQLTPTRTSSAPSGKDGTATAKLLAVLRIVVGFVFQWAFLDKAFGLGFGTPLQNPGFTAGHRPPGTSRAFMVPLQRYSSPWPANLALTGIKVDAPPRWHRRRQPAHQVRSRQ